MVVVVVAVEMEVVVVQELSNERFRVLFISPSDSGRIGTGGAAFVKVKMLFHAYN